MLKDQERFDLVAHFPSSEKARAAEDIFGGRLEYQNSVSFGLESWIGLGLGVLLGIAVGLFFFRQLLQGGFLPPSMAQSSLLATLLWVFILGASGWITGSVIHLFSSTASINSYELHITVRHEKIAEIRRRLIAGGATAINIVRTLKRDFPPDPAHKAAT